MKKEQQTKKERETCGMMCGVCGRGGEHPYLRDGFVL